MRNSLDVSQEYNFNCQSEPMVGTFRPFGITTGDHLKCHFPVDCELY